MGGENFIPIVLTLLFLLFFLDFYFTLSLSKYLKSKNAGRKSIFLLWSITISVFIFSVFINLVRLLHLFQSEFVDYSLLFIAIWYLPKIFISPVIIIKDSLIIVSRKLRKSRTTYSKVKQEDTNNARRNIIQNTGWILAGIPFLGVIDGAVRTTYNYKVFNTDITISKLPGALNGLRIVQISDIHAGSILSQKAIVELAFIIESLKADIIFVTGDFVNFSPRELNKVIPLLNNLRANYGVFGCLGNHDRYMTLSEHYELVRKIRACNINLLINENSVITINGEKLQIAGVDNSSYNSHYGDIKKTVSGLQDYLPTILLCHDPSEWDGIRTKYPFIDITMSGHTHGGQLGIKIPGRIITPAQIVHKYYAGLYQQKNQYIYVNRGIGTIGPPLRIGIDPEVTLLTLHSNEKFA